MITPDQDSAQVKVPPPLVLLLVVFLSIESKYFACVPFLSETLRWVVGAGLLLGGISLMVISVRVFKKHRTGIPPWKPTLVIVNEGPYRFTRNPIYISFMMMALGAICMVNNSVALVLLVPLFLFLNFYVIQKEEAYLLGKFPKEYSPFLKTTRRWL